MTNRKRESRSSPPVTLTRREALTGIAIVALTPSLMESAGAMRRRRQSAPANIDTMPVPRQQHTAVAMGDGSVLVAGGLYQGPLSDVRIYSNGGWTIAAPLRVPRFGHACVVLSNGNVLVLGGYNSGPLNSVEQYVPGTGEWVELRGLEIPRYLHAATALGNGGVLVTGGFNLNFLGDPEIYLPAVQ